jgi:ubiquinone/menaquinone biosynthesis C-methylase UbiE
LPFNDATFDHVFADNVLEHFTSEDVVFILNEIDRVLKIGGTAELIVPHAKSQGAHQDPTHKSYFVPRSVLYWNQVMSKYGGRFVGITANLAPLNPGDVETYGDMEEWTEVFIRFRLTKLDPTTTMGGT